MLSSGEEATETPKDGSSTKNQRLSNPSPTEPDPSISRMPVDLPTCKSTTLTQDGSNSSD